MKLLLRLKGGPGSGHRGHAGRQGKRGGSVAGVGGGKYTKLSKANINRVLKGAGLTVASKSKVRRRYGGEIRAATTRGYEVTQFGDAFSLKFVGGGKRDRANMRSIMDTAADAINTEGSFMAQWEKKAVGGLVGEIEEVTVTLR